MPLLLLLGVPLAMATGALAFKTVTDEVEETATTLATDTTPKLVMAAVAVPGLYLVFKQASKK